MHCPFIVYSVPVSMESIYHVTILCCYYCSVAKSCPTLCSPMNCSTASFSVLEEFGLFCPISQSLLKFMSIESVMLSISSSPALFSFCLQSFPASRSFPVSWLFASGGQSIGASALASFLPVNIQGWFPLGLISLISLLSRGLSYSANSTLIQCKSPVMF